VKIQAKFDISKWNGPQLVQRARFTFGRYVMEADSRLKASIATQQFEWPNVTLRKNKSTVTSPRDIIDTGRFVGSQERQMLNATTALFTWNVPYSSLILTGYVTKKGSRMPARDWITPAISGEYSMERFFEKEWQKLKFDKF
jgi:phage gpG-like protein